MTCSLQRFAYHWGFVQLFILGLLSSYLFREYRGLQLQSSPIHEDLGTVLNITQDSRIHAYNNNNMHYLETLFIVQLYNLISFFAAYLTFICLHTVRTHVELCTLTCVYLVYCMYTCMCTHNELKYACIV